MEYVPRVVDTELARALRISPVVNIVGPRSCGKTTTAMQHARSALMLNDGGDDLTAATRLRPDAALAGPEPRLLDEWQVVPALWSAVRRAADDGGRGRFILCGSAWPDDDTARHSGAGRVVDLRMRPMSLYESGESSGAVSLRALRGGVQTEQGSSPLTVQDVAHLIVRGGWPGWTDLPSEDAASLVRHYITALSERDFEQVAGTRRAPSRFQHFLRAYATLTAHPAPLSTVGQRLGEDGIHVGRDYPLLFHEFAQRLFVVEDQPPWAGRRRSRTRLVATPKRHLIDPSLAASGLRMDADGLLQDPETLGLLFESLVVRDLRVYSQPGEGEVLHYRSKDATAEIDAIVEWPNGEWIGVEVKLGMRAVEPAATRLVEVAAAIERPPQALLIVTPGGPAARLTNGVWVVPIGLLGP